MATGGLLLSPSHARPMPAMPDVLQNPRVSRVRQLPVPSPPCLCPKRTLTDPFDYPCNVLWQASDAPGGNGEPA